jgi:glycosyltransferase involved in cell wall biosynthesis
MRILLVNYEYPPVGGGAATAAEAIAKALVDLRHRVVVLTGRYKGLPASSDAGGIFIHRVPSLRRAVDRSGIFEMASFAIAGLMFVSAIIRRHQIEATIAFFSLPCGPIGWLGRRKCSIPYVVSLRGGDVPGTESSLNFIHHILAPIRRAVLKNSVVITANSEGLRKMAEAADQYPVRMIPNGVDSDFFTPADAIAMREEGAPLRILFVGRFQKQKNLTFLFEQLARLSPGTFELHLVGDGPEKTHLQGLAEQLGIAARITWRGWLSRAAVRDAYRTADCLANPSLYEGMPNVVLEAMACGLPVIASKVPGNEEVVLDGETGFLFDLGRPNSLLTAIELLIKDRTLASELGVSGRARAVIEFSWQRVAQAYVNILGSSTLSSR